MAISTPSDPGPTLVSPQSNLSKPPSRRKRSAKPAEAPNATPSKEQVASNASNPVSGRLLDAADDEAEEPEIEGDDEESDDDEELIAKARPGRRKLAAYPDFNSPIDLRGKKEDFEVWLANIDPDCWEFLIAYLYRTHPINDSSETGKPRYIRKFGSPFTYETIKQTEGSGAYKLDFCAIDPDSRKQRRIDRIYFELDDKDYPPRMPYGPWAERPENLKWAWCKSKLEGAPVDESAPSPGGSGGENTVQVIRATVAAMNSQGQQGTHINDLMARMADPNYHLTFMKSLKDIIGGKSEGDAGVVQIMMLMLDRSDKAQERMHTEMMQMRKDMTDRQAQTVAAAAPKTAVELLREQVEVKNLARQLAGSERGQAKDDDSMPGWLRPVIEFLGPPIAAMVMQRVSPLPAGPQQQQQPRPGQPAGGAPRPAVPPSQPSPGDTANPQENPDMDPRTLKLIKHQRLLQQIFPFLIDHFVNGVGEPEQNSGEAFRDFFLSRHSEPQWRELKEDLPPDFIVEYVGAVPELANALQLNVIDGKLDASGAAEIEKFMTDFYTDRPQENAS